jgi:adenosylcobyric acid synthase
MESGRRGAAGLGMLPGRTVLAAEKTTRRVEAFTPSGIVFEGYEIHLGMTTRPPAAIPFATLPDGVPDGVRTEGCAGTYLHGALENPQVLGELLGREVEPVPCREIVYDALADWFDANVDRRLFAELYLCS